MTILQSPNLPISSISIFFREKTMNKTIHLNPARVAYLEKAGWEAYYDRKWLRVLTLMVQLNREEFKMPWWTAIAAALDTVRAAAAFAPVDNDIAKATRYLVAFYEKARRHANIQAEAAALAELEMEYWIVHRELANRRIKDQSHNNIEPMIDALAKLHAALFAISEADARPSAEARAKAAVAVDRITGKYSTDVKADWREVEMWLVKAYEQV